MFGPIRAAAIDDEPAHLLSITAGLAAMGIPCVGYWFNRDTSELNPKPPDGGTPFLRVVFSDLNLTAGGGPPDSQTLWSVVVSVLKQLLSKDSGPYLLVFWTQVGSEVAAVRDLLYERADSLDGVPCPVAVLELDKGPFIIVPPTGKGFDEGLTQFYSELHSNIERLRDGVKKTVEKSLQLNAVAAWESRAAEAAAHSVNEVYRCARTDQGDPRLVADVLGRVMAKVAIAASGEQPAKEAPARALDAGMIDILADQFGASVDEPAYSKMIHDALSATLANKITFGNEPALYAELNTFFHVDRAVTKAKPSDRGAVVLAKSPFELGFTAKDLITKEFLFPHELFPSSRHEEIRQLLEKARESVEVVLIEVGAECDHAQAHDRTRRYLVGLEVPDAYMELARFHEDGKPRNASLQFLGPWKLDSEAIHLIVSCRRFWTWQKKAVPSATVRYRLRSSLVNKLLHHYSVWSSRPGIVEFRR